MAPAGTTAGEYDEWEVLSLADEEPTRAWAAVRNRRRDGQWLQRGIAIDSGPVREKMSLNSDA